MMHRCHSLPTPFRAFDANRSEGLKVLGNLPINQARQVYFLIHLWQFLFVNHTMNTWILQLQPDRLENFNPINSDVLTRQILSQISDICTCQEK